MGEIVGGGNYEQLLPHSDELVVFGRTIRVLDLAFESEENIRFRVTCSKGTYIRALARDIGEFLDSKGVLSSLRREVSGSFHIDDALALAALQQMNLSDIAIPIERLVTMLQGNNPAEIHGIPR